MNIPPMIAYAPYVMFYKFLRNLYLTYPNNGVKISILLGFTGDAYAINQFSVDTNNFEL